MVKVLGDKGTVSQSTFIAKCPGLPRKICSYGLYKYSYQSAQQDNKRSCLVQVEAVFFFFRHSLDFTDKVKWNSTEFSEKLTGFLKEFLSDAVGGTVLTGFNCNRQRRTLLRGDQSHTGVRGPLPAAGLRGGLSVLQPRGLGPTALERKASAGGTHEASEPRGSGRRRATPQGMR